MATFRHFLTFISVILFIFQLSPMENNSENNKKEKGFSGFTLPNYTFSVPSFFKGSSNEAKPVEATIVREKKRKRSEDDSSFKSTLYPTFKEWDKANANLPIYRDVNEGAEKPYQKAEGLSFQEIEGTIETFKATMLNHSLFRSSNWINGIALSDYSSYTGQHENYFQTYAQKLVLPAGAQVAFHGDLHGDVRSLLTSLQDLADKGYLDKDNPFKITKDDFYIIFLGDYTDRGNYGIEAIYTILRLKIENPDHIFMVRGNHEERDQNERGGFTDELKTKFPSQENLFHKIYDIYDLLPSVLYLGCKSDDDLTHYLQCNHGGIEIGYMPHALLDDATCIYQRIKKLNRLPFIHSLHQDTHKPLCDGFIELGKIRNQSQKNYIHEYNLTHSQEIGFLWNDFFVEKDFTQDYRLPKFSKELFDAENILAFNPSRGYIFGTHATKLALEASSTTNHKIIGVFRAHQHGDYENPMMIDILEKGDSQGVSKLWDKKTSKYSLWPNIVATFNVSPDTPYGYSNDYTFDTYGILTVGKLFPENWNLTIHRPDVFENY